MSEFYDVLEEYLGEDDALTDIRAVVQRLWFYDFVGTPLRLWSGKGRLFTTDGNEWLGTVDGNDNDHHSTPVIQDGRDGTSATYTFGLTIPEIPGESQFELYEALKADQALVAGRPLTCYLAVFQMNEGLRPLTPIIFYKQLKMIEPRFSEMVDTDDNMTLVRKYKVSVTAKDGNIGRSNRPAGTYADTMQKRRAAEMGVALDRGCEFLAALANRTYQVP